MTAQRFLIAGALALALALAACGSQEVPDPEPDYTPVEETTAPPDTGAS